MSRALWKGAISFGLIHVPVEIFSAEKRHELDFDMLDKRDMQPVGYQTSPPGSKADPWEGYAERQRLTRVMQNML